MQLNQTCTPSLKDSKLAPSLWMTRTTFRPIHRTCALIVYALVLMTFALLMPSFANAQTAVPQVTSNVTPTSPTYVDAVTGTIAIATASGQPAPTGTVTYSVDGGTASTATVMHGTAYLNLGEFTIGSHTLNTSYSGDGVYQSSTQAAVPFTVTDQPFAFVSTQGTTFFGDGFVFNVEGLATDSNNTLYEADYAENNVRSLDVYGNLNLLPVTGTVHPWGLAMDASNNLYIADNGNGNIYKYSTAGVQTTLPITGLNGPTELVLDRTRNLLYIADVGNQRVVRYDLSAGGPLSTVVPSAANLYSISLDPSGNLYYSDHLTGFHHLDASGDDIPFYANILSYGYIFVDRNGFIYVSDTGYNTLLRVDAQGHQTQINDAGNVPGVLADDSTSRIFLNLQGRVDVISPGFGRVADVTSQGANASINTLIYSMPQGQTSLSTTTSPAVNFTNFSAVGCPRVSIWGSCNTEVAFATVVPGVRVGSAVSTYTSGPTQSTIIYGNGIGSAPAFSPGTQTTSSTGVASVSGVALDQVSNYYTSDSASNQVSLTASGATSVLPFIGLSKPTALAVDGLAAVYALDSGNNRIVKLDAAHNQTVPVVAGSSNSLSSIASFALDGDGEIYYAGPVGASTSIYLLNHLAVTTQIASGLGASVSLGLDPYGNVYTLQQDGSVLRFDIHGTQTTLSPAGTFTNPTGIAVDASGTAYVVQSGTSAVTLVHPDLTTATIPVPALAKGVGLALDGHGSILTADLSTNDFIFIDRTHQDFNFGTVPINTTTTFTAFFANSGGQPFTITGLPGNNDFKLVTTADACDSSPATTTIAAAATCNLTYTVDPTAVGMLSANGRITTDSSLDFDSFSANVVQGATLSISPTTQVFPTTAVGATSATQTSTITNLSTKSVYLSQGTLTDATDFTQSNNCNGILSPNATCTVTFTYTPKSSGTLTSTYSINDLNTPGSPLTVQLSGAANATASTATLTPTGINFSGTVGGLQPGTQQATLTNSGSAALAISSITIAGSSAGSFSQSNNCGSSVAAGSTCTITILFTGTAAGSYSATLTVSDNASPATQAASLSATVDGEPLAALAPSSLSFSTTPGTTSAVQTATLSNTGSVSLTISSIAITGTNSSVFSQTNNCGTSVAPGGSCTISLSFMPTAAGSDTATLVVTDNSGNPIQPVLAVRPRDVTSATQTVQLSGTASATGTPQAALTPANFDFGSVTDATTKTNIFTLTNAGSALLPITSIALQGTEATNYAIGSNTCGSSLAAGQSCTIAVTFSPNSASADAASLSVIDSVGTQGSALTGMGVAVTTLPDFTISATPVAQTSYRGASVTYTIQLASASASNPFTSSVALTASSLPAGVTAAFSPGSVVPASSQPTSALQVSVPSLSARTVPMRSYTPVFGGAFAACLFAWFGRRRKIAVKLLLCFCALGALSAGLAGCGTGTGFALPSSTSTIVITGTSGSVTHTTSVTLTIQ